MLGRAQLTVPLAGSNHVFAQMGQHAAVARMVLTRRCDSVGGHDRVPLWDDYQNISRRAPRGALFQVRDMKHRTSKALFTYWNGVRGGRFAPQRFEIDPSRISAILPNTFILERVDTETFRFRLAGTRMCDMFGTELRNTNFLDGWDPMDRAPLSRQLAVLTEQGAVMVLYVKLATAAQESVECEVVLLPLLHTQRTVDRILGSCTPLSTPHWLGERPVEAKFLMANELVWPGHDPRAVIERAPVEPNVFFERNARIVRSQGRRFRVLEGGLGRRDVDDA
jgi:hypothetical protein